ncbi:MAG TPA: cell division protein FtsL [Kofleriaceae bacterium]|nr:cell division protein FtsL [Kofleriaceae bacterium]
MRVAVVCMMMLTAVAIALGVGHVSRRQEVIKVGYELGRAMSDLRAQQEENRRLRLERSVLTNPERIRKLAEARGMQQLTQGQVRVVRPARNELAQVASGTADAAR